MIEETTQWENNKKQELYPEAETDEREVPQAQRTKSKEIPRHVEIERSIIKRYRKSIWKPFVKALNEYKLIKEGDRIAVCISGGKDSMLLAKCMQEIKKHGKMDFDLYFIVMDPGYNKQNRERIEENAAVLNIPIHIFESRIFSAVEDITDSPCYLCARMRRGYLYKEAQRLGCNKIALGHHFDDVIETILMGMLYGAQIQTMMPKLHSTNHPGMELIRPLYLVKEDAIIKWAQFHELEFIQCACRFTEMYTDTKNANGESKREEMKELIAHFREISNHIEGNIFKSVENVNLNTLISYKKDGITHHFLEDYDDRGNR